MEHIHRAELYTYRVPFASPRGTKSERSALLVRVISDGGHEGWGEVAPLPGFSSETIDAAAQAARQLIRGLAHLEAPATPASVSNWMEGRSRLPSVQFGVSLALSRLGASIAGATLARWMSDSAAEFVEVNALLTGDSRQIRGQVRSRRAEGFAVYKMKVDIEDLSNNLERVSAARETMRPRDRLRLDANRSFGFDEALLFLQKAAPFHIEYMEEPLREVHLLKELASESPILLAGDELIQESVRAESANWVDRICRVGLSKAILKPTLLGSLSRVRNLAASLVENGIEPVLSSSFESGVGLSGIVSLAASLPECTSAAGLDTLRFMGEVVTNHGETLLGPRISASSAEDFCVRTDSIQILGLQG